MLTMTVAGISMVARFVVKAVRRKGEDEQK